MEKSPESEELKVRISDILGQAISGTNPELLLNGKYIKWGLVERRIREEIDKAWEAKTARDSEHRAKE